MPALTVLLPILNAMPYLPEALASLEAQTFRDFEVCFWDNGSTDGGWRMVDGEWRMANGEWRMANGEWRMANGEWRMANGEWRMAESGKRFQKSDQKVDGK
jgi:hypothetical protein